MQNEFIRVKKNKLNDWQVIKIPFQPAYRLPAGRQGRQVFIDRG
jgi:hypothetical protein